MNRLTLALALSTCGCAVDSLDVGGEQNVAGRPPLVEGAGGVGHATNTGGVVRPFPPIEGCSTDPEFAAFVGTWDGGEYDFSLTLVRRVRLRVNGVSVAGGICGTMLYGEAVSLPPVSDPDAMYPYADSTIAPRTIREGFTYTIVSGGARGAELHVGLNGSEVWRPWCEVQPPVFDSDGTAYDTCVEFLGAGEFDEANDNCILWDEEVSIERPLAKCRLCFASRGVCACNAEQCGASWQHPIELAFELVTEGGTLKLTDGKTESARRIVLERVD